MIRLFILIIIIFSTVLFQNKTGNINKRRKSYIIFISIILILQSGLRSWAVGSDTYQYYFRFEYIKSDSWNHLLTSLIDFGIKDPFYSIFQKGFQFFSESYQLYLLFVAFIFMTAFGRFIYKNTLTINHAMVSFIIYMGYFYGFYSITGIRQTLATAFLLWSYEYLKGKRYFMFILFVLIGALFHISAIVFIALLFVLEYKNYRRIFIFALISFPIVFYFKNILAIVLVSSSGLEDRFGTYTEQYKTGGSFILTLFQIILAIWGVIQIKRMSSLDNNVHRKYNVYAIALLLLPLQWVNPSAGRVAQYFSIIMVVWIPFLLDATSMKSVKTQKIIYFFTIISFVSLTLFSMRSIDEYKFFWEDKEQIQYYK
ncbi:EpsG family protein [Tenacibaculum sp. MAR_2010_89]|uniref:EpsG family protein n=1 Tax=Tenacibaculum sp. MAR_2010_89 TaxID=1250198 RepID=UPI0008972DDE|nr:EpsG family protein [Tenacibaculum sp. MAR_2010_89]SED67852.1 EpsG family protein [Tenacibaculum sp. MAR_2010_89]